MGIAIDDDYPFTGFPLVLEIRKRVWNLTKMLKGLERVEFDEN